MTKFDITYELFRTGKLSLYKITSGVRICEELHCDDCVFNYNECSETFNMELPRLSYSEFELFKEKYPEARAVL